MDTYEQVAQHHGLDEETCRRFLAYMHRRKWTSEEKTQCQTGYASEWAERFKARIEYQASDAEGRAILDLLAEEVRHG